MKNRKKAILVVNLGTPDNPGIRAVRKYLHQFLNDPRVIDLPWLLRKILVNLIIIPFRVRKSSRLYQRLWTGKGSPISIYLDNVVERLRDKAKDYTVLGAMRYGNPSLDDVLEKIRKDGFDEVIIFPMFPQYASATTGSVFELILRRISQWQVIPRLQFIDQYYSHPLFLKAVADRILQYRPDESDHIVFSYHGLPIRQINKVHPGIPCNECTCDRVMPEHGRHCYRATCFETTRLLAATLKLPESRYTTAFQSRLSDNWLAPFTDITLVELAQRGCKRVLVVSPSFVADCLETIIEIGEEYETLFISHNGGELVQVPCLNDGDDWIEAVAEIAPLREINYM